MVRKPVHACIVDIILRRNASPVNVIYKNKTVVDTSLLFQV